MPSFTITVVWIILACGASIAYAQDSVSSTAAWSSQIIAFWGAIALGARSSIPFQFTNGIGSILGLVNAIRRAFAIRSSLAEGKWYYISAGYSCDRTRVDVACICWRDQVELLRLALRISMLAETAGRGRWVIAVTGRRLKGDTAPAMAYWTQSPRCEDFTTVRMKDTGELYIPVPDDAVKEAITSFISRPADLKSIVTSITSQSNQSATRVAYYIEVPTDVQHCATLARHVTSWKDPDNGSPFVSPTSQTSAYGLGRDHVINCAFVLYSAAHLTVSVAVGLMAASTGRGLPVWLLTTRLLGRQLTPKTYCGDETLFTLLVFDETVFHLETSDRDVQVGGDATFVGLSWNKIVFAFIVFTIELGCIIGGWLYGSLKAERFAPSGLVGHGMLWLSTTVGVALAIRTLFGVHKRVSARLIGILYQHGFTQFIVPSDCTINVESPPGTRQDPSDPFIMLQLVSAILNDTEDDEASIAAGFALMRRPRFGGTLELFAVGSVFGFEYNEDCITKEKVPALPLPQPHGRVVITSEEYPWRQVLCCVIITVCGAAGSAIYAYVEDPPQWSKQIVEAGVAVSVIWFSSLDRSSKLSHSRETYISFMVASLVISSVWYVGVTGAG